MDNDWSIEDIQKRAGNNWSLEGDNQLLNLMKSISKNIEQRCNNLNRLMLDVDKTKVKLGNATTKLLDLNNSTFVEHTVMDIDSSLSNTEKCSTTENDKNFVPLPKAIEEAVTNGLNMMDRCYEKVLLELDDSDEDENENGQKHVMCRQRDPYLNRHLPHLIGSDKWNDKWHIGLIESDEEVLSEDEVEEFSQSSEDGDSISISPQTSNPPTASESDYAPTVIPQNDLFCRLSDDVEENSPLFTPDFHANREKIKVLPTIVPSTQNEPKVEATNKSKPLVEPSVPSQPQQSIFVQQRTEKKFLNLFDDEPPLLEEPIRNERKPVNLFLDSDEEDDLITNVNKKPTSIFNNNTAISKPSVPFAIPQVDSAPVGDKSKNLFLDDVDNNNVSVVSRSDVKPKAKSNDFGGLFDDEPPDDFFDIIVRDKGGKLDNQKLEKPKLQSKTVNLFDSDDEDDFIGTSSKDGSSGPVVIPSVKKNIVAKSSAKESISIAKQIERTDISHQGTHSPFNSPFKSLQNTGPPKSYKSFLDDEPPSFDEDKEESISHKPTASVFTPSKKGLFDDKTIVSLPPSTSEKSSRLFDDELVVSTTPSTIQKGLFDDEPSVSLPPFISKKGLFDDKPAVSLPPSKQLFLDEEPPPDDIIAPPATSTQKSPMKIFYNDIADTLPSKTTLSDESQVTVAKSSEAKCTNDETDQSLSFKKNLTMFSNPEMAKPPTIEKDKPKPNKLKTNFNINVAALLPGAKLPSQKQLVTAKLERTEEPMPETNESVGERKQSVGERKESFGERNTNVEERKEIVKDVIVASVPKVTSVDDTSGLLTSLSKTRAKIQVQRKPSTRSGRQRLYSKSLLRENQNAESNEATDSGSSKPEDVPEPEETTHVVPSENLTEQIPDVVQSENISKTDIEDDWLSKSTMSEQLAPQDSDEEDWLKNVDEKPSSPSKTNLYDENDWLSAKVTNSEPKSTNLSHVMNYDWLTASSLPPEDINPPPTYSVDDYHEQDEQDWLTSYVTKEKPSIVEDLPNDEDDWLTSTEKPQEAIPSVTETKPEDDWLVTAISKSEKKNDAKIDDDNYDWFSKSVAPKASSTEIRKSFVSEIPKLSPPKLVVGSETTNIFESKAPTKKSLNSSLFDDEDEEDDDLFGSISKQKSEKFWTNESSNKIEAVKSTKNASIKITGKSLFSDDDESDPEDLFGSSSKTKITQKENNQKRGEKKTKSMDKPMKGGLFDDEDDDDEDIFSSKTQKTHPVNKTDKKPSITKLVATIPASNDPLADLLK